MTKEEYLQLLNASRAFKELPADVMKFYLDAEPKYFEEYSAIFVKEQNFLLEIKKELMMKNDAVLKTFANEMKAGKKQYLKKAEESAQEEDASQQSQLLNELNNQ